MTYEEKLEVLRETGIIDMRIGLGCNVLIKEKSENKYNRNRDIIIACIIESNRFHGVGFRVRGDLGKKSYAANKTTKYKLLGHDLLYGRICRWIEKNKSDTTCNWCGDDCITFGICESCERKWGNGNEYESQRHFANRRIMFFWKRKDLPLSQQENKEDIVDFIYSLIKH